MAIADGTTSAALIERRIRESADVTQHLLDGDIVDRLAIVAARIVQAYLGGGQVLFFGNGGSAADAQHLAAEMCGRFLLDRRPLPALALADNTAATTAIANDYGYDEVFSRQVEAFGAPGDVAVGISTSGNSANVLRAIAVARERGLTTVALTGTPGGRLATAADFCICVPSSETPRIQEAHGLLGHVLCEIVESALFAS